MSRTGLAFVHSPLDRRGGQRTDAAALAALRADARAHLVRLTRDGAVLVGGAIAEVGGAEQAGEVFLGVDPSGAPWFAAPVAEAPPGAAVSDLRSLAVAGAVPAPELGILAQARSLVDWHARHGFCAACGAATAARDGGSKRVCPACKAEHFPRTDPVAIAVIRHRGAILLGRQRPWPRGMYSALAGFVEPGETLEDAVRREVLEEAGVRVGELRYVASQPWPFPSSLMLGFIGEAASDALSRDDDELEDVRWFSAEEARQMVSRTHPEGLWAAHPIALAHHLVRAALELPAGDAPTPAPPARPDVPFVVMRQDDNGNRVQVARAQSRGQAEAIADDFERRGHKQLYWVEPEMESSPS